VTAAAFRFGYSRASPERGIMPVGNTQDTWALHPIGRFDRFAAAWDRVNDRAGGVPFHYSVFIANLLRAFGTGTEQLAVLGPEGGEAALCVLRPQRRGVWETFQPSQLPLGAMVAAPGVDVADATRALLRRLPGMPLLLALTQQDPWLHERPSHSGSVRTIDYINTGWVAVEGGFDDYWKARSKNLRQNMRTQRSRLARENIRSSLEEITEPAGVADAIADFARLETAGWKGAEGSAVQVGTAQGRFYQTMMEDYCRAGAGRIYRYRFDDRVVAVELNIEAKSTMVLLKTTYDETVSGLSPAALMREEVYRRLFDEGRIRRIEYYGRVMDWTLRWTDRTRTLYHVNVYRWPALATVHERVSALRALKPEGAPPQRSHVPAEQGHA
jgi:CelD/BcsL family acetyltransferase involved in cellulose biosynthesis